MEAGTIETLRLQKGIANNHIRRNNFLKIRTKVTTSTTPLSPPKWK
jgi:hypothetical protein